MAGCKVCQIGITLIFFNTRSIRVIVCSQLQKGSTVRGNNTRVELMSEDTSDTKVLRASWSPVDPLSPHPALLCKQPCGTACSYNLLSASRTYVNGWKRTCVGLLNKWRLHMVKWSTEEELFALPPLRCWWTASITISSQSIGWLNSVWN